MNTSVSFYQLCFEFDSEAKAQTKCRELCNQLGEKAKAIEGLVPEIHFEMKGIPNNPQVSCNPDIWKVGASDWAIKKLGLIPLQSRVQFAAFSRNGSWRLEDTSGRAFMWVKSLPESDHRGYYRIYRLRPDRDLYETKYRLFYVMRNRYGVEPV